MITLHGKSKVDFAPLLSAFCEELGVTQPYAAELDYATPRRIKKVNRETRGVDRVTDILPICLIELLCPAQCFKTLNCQAHTSCELAEAWRAPVIVGYEI